MALAHLGRVQCPLRFPGQYHDGETGHDYNLNRYYDPAAGAYLSPDPLGLDASPNPHGYVPNPITWFDPLGLKCEPKRIYDDSSYKKHGRTERQTSRGVASRAPANGQAALDRSIDPDPDNPAVFRRYGVDHENNEIVVLHRHHFDPRIGEVLRRFRNDGIAAAALDHTLQYVPFRQLPSWLKVESIRRKVRWLIFRS
jgi:RHS repeat-associated protein